MEADTLTSAGLITLHGHRLSSLYRGTDSKPKSSCFKCSQERERPGLSHGAQRHHAYPLSGRAEGHEAVMKSAGAPARVSSLSNFGHPARCKPRGLQL
jgi:hypothetical protein